MKFTAKDAREYAGKLASEEFEPRMFAAKVEKELAEIEQAVGSACKLGKASANVTIITAGIYPAHIAPFVEMIVTELKENGYSVVKTLTGTLTITW